MAEKDLNTKMTEETIVAKTEEVAMEPAVQELPAEAPKDEPKPERKARRKKACCEKEGKKPCKALTIGAVCLTALAMIGCAVWLWKKFGGKSKTNERLNMNITRFFCR